MKRLKSLALLAAGLVAGAAGSYWYVHRPEPVSPAAAEQTATDKDGRKILY